MVTQFILQVTIQLQGYCYPADLISFDIKEFDLILGMDWLARYQVTSDGKKKKLHMPDVGDCLVS